MIKIEITGGCDSGNEGYFARIEMNNEIFLAYLGENAEKNSAFFLRFFELLKIEAEKWQES